jgi:hypothetical protein
MVRPKGLSAAAEPSAPRGSSPVALLELFPLPHQQGSLLPMFSRSDLNCSAAASATCGPSLTTTSSRRSRVRNVVRCQQSTKIPGRPLLPRETSRRRLHNGPRDSHRAPATVAFWRKGDKNFWCRGGLVGRGFEVSRGEVGRRALALRLSTTLASVARWENRFAGCTTTGRCRANSSASRKPARPLSAAGRSI